MVVEFSGQLFPKMTLQTYFRVDKHIHLHVNTYLDVKTVSQQKLVWQIHYYLLAKLECNYMHVNWSDSQENQ